MWRRESRLGCQGGLVIFYDLTRGIVERQHSVNPATPGSLAFSAGGETLLVGLIGDPRTPHDVQVLNVATGRVLTKFHGHDDPVWSVAFLPDGRRALSAGTDRTLRVWDIATGRELKRFDDHPGAILCLAVSPDGRLAIAGTGHAWSGRWTSAGSYGVEVWDLEAGVGLGRFETTEPIRTVILSPDGRRAFAAGDDRVIHAWNLPAASSKPATVADHPESSAGTGSVDPCDELEIEPELVRFGPPDHSHSSGQTQPAAAVITPGATAGTKLERLSRTVPARSCIDIDSAGPTRHSSSTSSSRVENGM